MFLCLCCACVCVHVCLKDMQITGDIFRALSSFILEDSQLLVFLPSFFDKGLFCSLLKNRTGISGQKASVNYCLQLPSPDRSFWFRCLGYNTQFCFSCHKTYISTALDTKPSFQVTLYILTTLISSCMMINFDC